MARENPQRILVLLSMAALIGYGGLLFENMATGVGGSDSSGYANTARDLLGGRIGARLAALDQLELPERFAWAFIPLGYEEGPRPRTMAPLYPSGFPLHLAFAALVAGWEAGPFIVSPIFGLLAAILMYFLGRELSLSRPLAFAGAAIFAACPVFLFQAVQPMSDIVAAAWSVAAVLFALRSRRSDVWAAAAGAAYGIAVLVRPTCALLLLPLVCALAWRLRTAVLFAAGGAPFALFLGLWNRAAYGSPFRTGYTDILPGTLSFAHFGSRFRNYGGWIVRQLSPIAPLGWLASAFCRSLRPRDRVLLLSWFGSFFLFYCFWGPADDWFFTRYLLPGIPALILGFLVSLRDLLRALPAKEAGRPGGRLPYGRIAAWAALFTVAAFELRMDLRHPRPYHAAIEHGTFPEVCRALAAKAGSAKALVVSRDFSGALRFYTDLTPLRWDALSAEDFALVRVKAAEKGYRVFAAVMPYEVEDARPRVPGDWVFLGNVRRAGLFELAREGEPRPRPD